MTHKSAVLTYLHDKFGMNPQDSAQQYDIEDWLLRFDPAFYGDFANFAQWMQSVKMMDQPLTWSSFVYLDGLRDADPRLVTPPPK